MQTMRLGIAGAGRIAKKFLPTLAQMEDLQIKAVWNRSVSGAVQLAAMVPSGAAVLEDYEGLLCSGIDAVYLALPNDLHAPFAEKALRRGVHVISEKPLTSNLREAEALAALAKQTGCFVFEALSTPYLDSLPVLRRWLPRIGALRLAQSQFTQYSSRYDRFARGEITPAFDPKHAGGALLDLGIYTLSLLLGLLGEPTDLQYHANLVRDIDVSGVLTLQYPDAQALCVFAKDCGAPPFALLEGTKGTIRADGHPGRLEKLTLRLADGTEECFLDRSFARLPQFRAAIEAWKAQDAAFFDRALAHSLQLARLMTRARGQAGIVFPADA